MKCKHSWREVFPDTDRWWHEVIWCRNCGTLRTGTVIWGDGKAKYRYRYTQPKRGNK